LKSIHSPEEKSILDEENCLSEVTAKCSDSTHQSPSLFSSKGRTLDESHGPSFTDDNTERESLRRFPRDELDELLNTSELLLVLLWKSSRRSDLSDLRLDKLLELKPLRTPKTRRRRLRPRRKLREPSDLLRSLFLSNRQRVLLFELLPLLDRCKTDM
jgi:hypothetical protein